MFTRRILFLALILTVVFAHESCAETINNPKGLLPNPIEIAKWQIEKFIEFIENMITTQVKILNEIRETVSSLAEKSIEAAIKAIDVIIDGTVGRMRRIFQDALDKGINITECYVLNMDKLRILRRQLIVAEIQCVTNQAGEFYDIIDEAMKNFTENLFIILELPKRLKKCIVTIAPITCVTKIIDDITDLQKSIPQQILGTMEDIVLYMNGFDQRVHKCQFAQIRKAIEGTRAIIDNLLECVRHPEGGTGDSALATQVEEEKHIN